MNIICKSKEIFSYLSERFLLHYHLERDCFENDVAKKKGKSFKRNVLENLINGKLFKLFLICSAYMFITGCYFFPQLSP